MDLKTAKEQLRWLEAIQLSKEKLATIQNDLEFQYRGLMNSGYPMDEVDMRDAEPLEPDYRESIDTLVDRAYDTVTQAREES